MKVYFVGVGGVGMGNIALLLKQAGHQVLGSDATLYPPMSELLAKGGVQALPGYFAHNIPDPIDLAVIGNVVRRDNVEVLELQRRGVKMLSMPQVIRELLLPGKESLIVAGTHGKTTTSAWLTFCLQQLGQDPGYFIGGAPKDFPTGAALGKGKYFVLEGDEYDSAFFQKESKFLSYNPKHVVITSIEFDHSDIYQDVEQVREQFRRLIQLIPADGTVVVHSGDSATVTIARAARCKVYTYGTGSGDDFQVCDFAPRPGKAGGCRFVLKAKPLKMELPLEIALSGLYNAENAASICALMLLLRMDAKKFTAALPKFRGVERRQQLLWEGAQGILIEDFAHHPTAIRVTLEGLRLQYPGLETWALFEPRSNTSTRNYLQQQFIDAFKLADVTVLYRVFRGEQIDPKIRFDREEAQRQLTQAGKVCHLADNVDQVLGLLSFLQQAPTNGTRRLVVVMSNGSFDGLVPSLKSQLGRTTA